ncbi:Afadin- and alpha-actinin-binding protein [Chytriomyces hyalinus]|nr:Afadin- and alpha-actinin-binding protein [Chytriomyces hyalinus]
MILSRSCPVFVPIYSGVRVTRVSRELSGEVEQKPLLGDTLALNYIQSYKSTDVFTIGTQKLCREQKSLVHAMLVGAGYGQVELPGAHKRLIRAVFSLLSQTRTDAAHRSELMNRIRDLDFDAENALTAMNRCKQQLDASDRVNKALNSKLELAKASIKDLTEKYTIAKDEDAKSTLYLSSAMAQFKVLSKFPHLNYSTLTTPPTPGSTNPRKKKQNSLPSKTASKKLTTEQLHAGKIGMRIVNPSMKKMSSFNLSTAAAPKTAAAKAEKHENDLHAVAIRTYEEREKELLVELEDVKDTIYRVFQRMKAAVLKVKDADGLSTRTVFSSDSHEEARFHLPYNLVKTQINAHFESLVSKYEQLITSQPSHEPVTINTIDSFELTKLQNTVDEYKGIIEKQQHLLDMALDTNPEYVSNHSGLPDDSQIISDIEDQKEILQRRGEQLDEELRKFTEAAIRLGRERVAFEQAKEAYEEEMRAISTQHILSEMPDTPLWMKTQPIDTRKPTHVAPSTPTPTTNPPRARTQSAAPSTPASGISRSSSFPGGLAFAADDEFIAEISTFASTPGVLKMMMEEREVSGDEGVEGEEFPATPSCGSLKVGNTRVVKSALKKNSPGSTLGSAGSLAKRRVEFGL